MPYSPALRRANELVLKLHCHASTFARSLSDPLQKNASVRDWGPVVLADDVEELAGYLRQMDGRAPLADRLRKTGNDAENLWLEAKGQRPRTVPEGADPWKFARIATVLFIVALDEARKELKIESESIPGLGDFLQTFTQPSKSGGKGGAGAKVAVVSPPVDKPTLATAILLNKPDISPTELATKVGVSRGTLYSRAKQWKPVRDTLLARDSARALKGTKSREGDIEAEAEHREFHPTDD